MEPTVLFIHGTGVRAAGLAATMALLRRQAAELLPGWRFEACAWGDAFGAALNRRGASLPLQPQDEVGDVALAAQQRARWVLLADDPLIELRVAPHEELIGDPPGPVVWASLCALRQADPQGALGTALAAAGALDAWPAFIDDVAADAQWAAVVQSLVLSAPAASPLVARALVAALSAWLREQGRPGVAAPQRDALVGALLSPLGGPPADFLDWMLGRMTGYVRRRRGSLSDLGSPLVGDILRYQARGATLRKFIGEEVQRTGARVLLAHSLGGIAAVDWLALGARPVDVLVTVGSQAAYLYEIDALASRAHGSGLPPFFPQRWLNVHDDNDFLSYPAADIFKGKVLDVRVDNGEPFPESHSGYFRNPAFWQALSDTLKAR